MYMLCTKIILPQMTTYNTRYIKTPYFSFYYSSFFIYYNVSKGYYPMPIKFSDPRLSIHFFSTEKLKFNNRIGQFFEEDVSITTGT